ncbi:MAG TPA: DsbA family protein [Candidatus Nanoarchaeia archaeon]|nr:DsbA family protein [Candidatus Nanoarchaeia archaeon]
MNEHEETVTLKKSTIWKAGTAVFAILFVISLFTGGFGLGRTSTVTGGAIVNPPAAAPAPAPLPAANVNAADFVDDDPALGKENAPVTIVEFSDFQCPFCSRFRTETFDQIKSQYIDTGKVRFVYRDFPLTSIHPQAQKAAEASECADEQGKFWEYHDQIFLNQQLMSIDSYKAWAQELGLDSKKFSDCLDSGKYASEVSNDLNDGAAAGGRGTPYFLVGNTPVSGAVPFSVFQQAIEAQLG